MLAAAEAAAMAADACIVVVGTHGFWELEGIDQPHMRLIGSQDSLVERVSAVAKGPVIVVLNVGSPKELPWLRKADAVLLAHFGGQAMAGAVADVLVGKACPAGRLPTTWPQRFEASSAVAAMQQIEDERLASGGPEPIPGDVPYAEGLHLGYRANYTNEVDAPLFPFGFGLSYTRFEYGPLRAEQQANCDEREGARASAQLTIRNIGEVAGAEVVQLYVLAGPGPRALRGFQRTAMLAPGEEVSVTFDLDSRALGAHFDVEVDRWRGPAAGLRATLTAGSDSATGRSTTELVLQ